MSETLHLLICEGFHIVESSGTPVDLTLPLVLRSFSRLIQFEYSSYV